MLSKVYFSDRLWRILKRREPRLEAKDSSSSIMSLGTLIFFPRSISISEQKETKQDTKQLVFIQCLNQTSDKTNVFSRFLYSHLCWIKLNPNRKKKTSLHKRKNPVHGCWLSIPASMMNEELSSLVISSCSVLVLWFAPHASYCMLIMEMSSAYIQAWDT